MKKSVPFFAKFLERQQVLDAEGMSQIKGGERTLKFPSDKDEAIMDEPTTETNSAASTAS